MKQKRKELIKPRHNSFHKEYSFEIKVILLFTLGIFLLVEDLEIKQYIFEAIRRFFFTIGLGIKWFRDSIQFLIKQFEVSDIVGISLILYVVYLVASLSLIHISEPTRRYANATLSRMPSSA